MFVKLVQAFRWKSLLKGGDGVDGSKNVKKPSWMVPISHGYHIVEGRSWRGEDEELEKPDNVVVQREEIDNLELWFYGVSDAGVGDGISRYLQSNLFDRKLKEVCSCIQLYLCYVKSFKSKYCDLIKTVVR